MQSPWDAVYLEQILQRRSVLMAFQPVVTLLDGSVIGHEALARPVGEPADGSVEWLFDAARRAGRSRDLDWLCWRSAIQGDSPGPQRLLFLNVSADILLDPDREVGQLLLLLTTTSWSPIRVVLEITEQEPVRDLPRVRDLMDDYRLHGVRFAVDDIGEGHSTFDAMSRLVPEFVKLSIRLTQSSSDPEVREYLASVVEFACVSGAVVIAEGVETREDATRMLELGVEVGQGYWLGRPAFPASVAHGEVVGRGSTWSQPRAAAIG